MNISLIQFGTTICKWVRNNKAFILSFIAIGLSFYNFWYIHIRNEDELIGTILGANFGHGEAYSIELGFSNTGNGSAVISEIALNLSSENETSIRPLNWNINKSIVLEPGALKVLFVSFGENIVGKILRSYKDLEKIVVTIEFNIVDRNGDIHKIYEPLGYSYVHNNNLFTIMQKSIPRKIVLLPSDISRRIAKKQYFHISSGPPKEFAIYFDEISGDPRIEVIKWDTTSTE